MKKKSPTPRSQTPGSSLERYRVPILDRTLDVLELLAKEPGGMTLPAMTEALKMPKNSVFRIATTLMLRGYLERDETARIYRASRRLLSLGHSAVGGRALTQTAWPVLRALRDETGETALLGTLAGAQGVVLEQAPSSQPVKVVVEVGHAFPLHTAAPAKAMLAHLEEAALERLLAQMTFEKRTRHTVTSKRRYLEELTAARRDGYALDRGEESETFTCAAAPVFDFHGVPVAALWISGPVDRMPVERLGEFGQTVRRHAEELSRKLGWDG